MTTPSPPPRAIIANRGTYLAKPADSYTKVCLPAALPRVIQSAPVTLSPQTTSHITSLLRAYLPR